MADGIEILKKTGAGKYRATIYKFKSMNDTHTNNIYIYIYTFSIFSFSNCLRTEKCSKDVFRAFQRGDGSKD